MGDGSMMLTRLLLSQSITIAVSFTILDLPIRRSLRSTFLAGFSHLRNTRTNNRVSTSFSSDIMSYAAATESSTFIDKLALIMINSQNKQLVARSYGKSVFYTPGGKREHGETDEQALIRECQEELSINLSTSATKPASLQLYGVFQAQAFGKPEGTMVRMTCYRICPREAELELVNLVKANSEIEELKWIDYGFEREKLTVTGIMILDDLKEKNLLTDT